MISESDLRSHQIAILKSPYDSRIIADGGVGTFKTTACVFLLYSYLLENPGARVMVLMQTNDQIKRVFRESWKNVVPDVHYHKLPGEEGFDYQILGGAQIAFQYADHPKAVDRIRGMDLTGYYISQGETISRDDLSFELDQRTRIQGVPHLRLIDSNGGIPSRIVYRRFIDPDSPEFVADKPEHRELSPGVHLYQSPGYRRIHIETTPETSVYPESEIEAWRRQYPEALFRRLVMGEWTAATGVVYPDFNRHLHVDEFDPDPAWTFFRGIDYGHTNPFCCLWVAQDGDGKWYVFDEWYKAKTLLPDHAGEIVTRWPDLHITATYMDPSGPVRELENALDQPIDKGYNPVRYGIEQIQRLLVANRLVIHPRCRNLIRELESYQWKAATAAGLQPEEPIKRDDHAPDALRYVIASETRRNG